MDEVLYFRIQTGIVSLKLIVFFPVNCSPEFGLQNFYKDWNYLQGSDKLMQSK
jgi:hypothetical protein